MKIEVFKDGKLLYSIEGTDDFNSSDIVVVAKNLIDGATMTAEKFDDLFFTKLKDSRTHLEAYTKAEEVHYETFGHNKYRDFDSFRCNKSRRLNSK